ncbi:ammonium transporter [Thioalkalivibrio sp. AKL12]|uniref:ammonium transporter n=1 Tax=Thioalkalivibrio sp. AKL12 TaxID=1158159 RepID=UPI000362422A|nr:ammonium transporter [Thioalkalivibrio sp. AKL12]
MQLTDVDVVWVLVSATLVLLMQAAFLSLETGLTRHKNAINVAMKNAADLMITLLAFWAVGFGLMFGPSFMGLVGTGPWLPDLADLAAEDTAFFVFQAMFAATAATIVSGAVSERMSYVSYGLVTLAVVVVIYPLTGHWAWGGVLASGDGWLAALGFVDFAGATVVHSVGGWVALAAILVVGPRIGRFTEDGVQRIPASNLPLAVLGGLFFLIGWVGFNGGSELGLTERVPAIIGNTFLAAAAGAVTAYLLGRRIRGGHVDNLLLPLNGLIAGLVAITAGAHAVSTGIAVLIGAIGAAVMLIVDLWMIRRRLDDSVGAVPVHLAAGIWGTLATGMFGQLDQLGTGLGRLEQVGVQALGIVVIGATAFILAWLMLRGIDRWHPLRVSAEDETAGLNVSEHGARTDLLDLLTAMERQASDTDLSRRVPVEPFTEVGQIARRYNEVMAALERAVNRTRTMFRDMTEGIVTFDTAGQVISLNPGAEKLLATDEKGVSGRPLNELFQPLLGDHTARGIAKRLQSGAIQEVVGEIGGQKRHLELHASQSDSHDQTFFTAVVRDITERRQVQDQLDRERELAQVTLESIVDAVIATDAAGRVRFINSSASHLSRQPAIEAEGLALCDLFRFEDVSSKQDCGAMIRSLLSEGHVLNSTTTWSLTTASGETRIVEYTAAPIFDRDREMVGSILVLHDVTEARAMQRQLSHQATHDALTGLFNRREFETRLAETLTGSRDQNRRHVLFYIDLDQFKVVNDTCGHLAGDELLRQISQVIGNCLRESDIFARLGGDEFGVILLDCPVSAGQDVAEKIREQVYRFRFPWKGRHFALGSSIGMVPLEAGCSDLAGVLGQADAACYVAKEHGRNRVHLFEPDDQELAERQGQMQWASRIRSALDRDRLRLYYQPIVPATQPDTPAGHHEILVRLLDDEDNLVPPSAFIPAAERYGLMLEVDRWVVRNTLAWMGDMERADPDHATVCAINLSGASLGDAALLAEIQALLDQHQVPGKSVCFEITETSAISNFDVALHFIETLSTTGCRFSLDDFGSGLSSFGYLRNLPVQFVKIDGAFIREIANNPTDEAMVRSIHSIAHTMGLQTIAEFVEDASSIERLAAIGIDFVQGYYIARPRPLEQFGGVKCMPR